MASNSSPWVWQWQYFYRCQMSYLTQALCEGDFSFARSKQGFHLLLWSYFPWWSSFTGASYRQNDWEISARQYYPFTSSETKSSLALDFFLLSACFLLLLFPQIASLPSPLWSNRGPSSQVSLYLSGGGIMTMWQCQLFFTFQKRSIILWLAWQKTLQGK